MGEKHVWGYYGNGKGEQSVCEYVNVYTKQNFFSKLWGLLKSKPITE